MNELCAFHIKLSLKPIINEKLFEKTVSWTFKFHSYFITLNAE